MKKKTPEHGSTPPEPAPRPHSTRDTTLHLKLDAETRGALAALTADGTPATQAARRAIREYAGGMRQVLAALARIEARMDAGGAEVVPRGGTGETDAAQATRRALGSWLATD